MRPFNELPLNHKIIVWICATVGLVVGMTAMFFLRIGGIIPGVFFGMGGTVVGGLIGRAIGSAINPEE